MSARRPAAVLLMSLVVLAATSRLPAQAPAQLPNQETAKDAVKAANQAPARADDPAIAKIREEGMERSEVMKTLSYLTDVIGPRLTASPGLKRANEWTRDRLSSWGLSNAHLEAWGPFGRGWSLKRFSIQVVEPQCIPLIGFPKAWSYGTDGPITAEVVYLDAKDDKALEGYKGKLQGKIVLVSPPRDLTARFEPLARRLSDSELLVLADAAPGEPRSRPRTVLGTTQPGPNGQPFNVNRMRGQAQQRARALRFAIEEGAAAVVDASMQGDGGTLFVAQATVPPPAGQAPTGPGGGGFNAGPRAWQVTAPKTPAQITLAAEHYNRLVRMVQQGETLKIALDLAVAFHDEDLLGYNTVAEIPGSDLKDELVMVGGHLDSWHSGTGATDNAAGVAAGMEAVRILQALHIQPRRTIRIALWTGEEQGLLGSRAYVAEHFGGLRRTQGPGQGQGRLVSGSDIEPAPAQDAIGSETKAEHEKLSVYLNLDNGTGRIRGVYMEGNEAVRPIFRRWLSPFRDLDATTLTASPTGGTDHQSFDAAGLPAFQFIQDPVDYNTRTHHSNMDVYDRLQADDLKQAAVIIAALLHDAADAPEKLPRKPR